MGTKHKTRRHFQRNGFYFFFFEFFFHGFFNYSISSTVKLFKSIHTICYTLSTGASSIKKSTQSVFNPFLFFSLFPLPLPFYSSFYCAKDDSSLSELLDRLVIEQCRGKRLQDYLIMPIQRIPRYSLMLSVCFPFLPFPYPPPSSSPFPPLSFLFPLPSTILPLSPFLHYPSFPSFRASFHLLSSSLSLSLFSF